MDFKSAANFAMPFGKHKGKALDVIATTDEGLLYLDWLAGYVGYGIQGKEAKEAIDVYLADSTISKEVQRLVDNKK